MRKILVVAAIAAFLPSLAAAIPAPGDTTPPSIRVLSPNGGESFAPGTLLPISWSSSDDHGVTSHDIRLSLDGGRTFGISVAAGLSGATQSFSYLIPSSLNATAARVIVSATDTSGNVAYDLSDADFAIASPPDTQPPTVSLSAPAPGSVLLANASLTIQFSAADDVGVASIDLHFAADGANFDTTLAAGLPGTASSFAASVPAVATTRGAIRVAAYDAAGNKGTAAVGSLTILVDTAKPTVSVTSPLAKDKFRGGEPLPVAWSSSDDTGVVSHEILLSLDGGASFSPLVTGLPGTARDYQLAAPDAKEKDAVLKVVARDAAGNSGEGVSGAFKLKAAKD